MNLWAVTFLITTCIRFVLLTVHFKCQRILSLKSSYKSIDTKFCWDVVNMAYFEIVHKFVTNFGF